MVNSSERALNVEYESFSSFAQLGSNPHRIILGMRLPSMERYATSIGRVGGIFQSRSKFGAGASVSNFKRIFFRSSRRQAVLCRTCVSPSGKRGTLHG